MLSTSYSLLYSWCHTVNCSINWLLIIYYTSSAYRSGNLQSTGVSRWFWFSKFEFYKNSWVLLKVHIFTTYWSLNNAVSTSIKLFFFSFFLLVLCEQDRDCRLPPVSVQGNPVGHFASLFTSEDDFTNSGNHHIPEPELQPYVLLQWY